MPCPRSSEGWSPPLPIKGELHIVPLRQIGLRLTLQQFMLYPAVSCTFKKICCTKKCPGLPVDPCGLVKGKCVARLHVHDRYDFEGDILEWTGLELLGQSYNIDIYWKEKFTVGPKKLCGTERRCNNKS